MRQILMGLIVMSFIACGDNQGAGSAQDTTGDSTYTNNSSNGTGGGGQTDTSTMSQDSTSVKAGAGQGTGSGSLPSQDTGTRRP